MDRQRQVVVTKAGCRRHSRQYLPLRRRWSGGDVIRAQFSMQPQLLESNTQVIENNGRVAVQRGPLVYCLEQIDQPEDVALKDVALQLVPN